MTTPDSKTESFADLLAQAQGPAQRRLRVGERVEGVVTKVGKVAVFVTVDGPIEAYVNLNDVIAKDGSVAVQVGSRMICKVAEVGGRSGAVRLSPVAIKTADETSEAAPAQTGPVIAEGVRVKGAVTRVERYGVFVQIAGTQGRQGRGLLPAAESGSPRGADLNKAFPVGAEVEAKIVKIDADGKIRLSVTAMKADEERGEYESFAKQQGGDEKREAKAPKPERIGTFGQLLAKQLASKAKK